MRLRKTHIALLLVGVAVVTSASITLLQNRQSTLTADEPVGTATLKVGSATAKVGEEVTVDIALSTGGTAGNNQTSGVDIYLAYDPAILAVVDSDAIAAGSQIQPGELFDFIPANKVNANLGVINFSASQQPTNGYVQADNQVLATIHFKALKDGRSTLKFDFTAGALDDTNVIKPIEGMDLLYRVEDGIITVTE